jgi:hypothetical protein
MRHTALVLVVLVLSLSATAANINITYTVSTDVNRTPISKYIYGSNWGGGTDYTIRRSGGNRLTAYNWENNFSNAGADWWWNNDNYMSSSTIPGKAITDFHNQALSQGQASIVTLQMAGYVSADKNGYVDCNTQAAPSSRFKKVVFAKGAPFVTNPVTTDANVYMDEFINFLVSTYGYAGTANGVKFYCMDNEPDLWYDTGGPWYGTHWEVHPYDPCCVELKDKTIALAKAVKNVDPNAQLLGFVSYGFAGYLNFQGAPDWTSVQGSYGWFINYFLDKMKVASDANGRRLIDALDVHWYPEAQDNAGNRITNTVNTNAMYTARMQAPRTLWDSSYVYPNITYPTGEVSWINQSWFAQYLPLIPRLKADIAQYYPDTNLAFTEYDYGGQTHWSGGIATADVLGIFGKYGVYIATYWGDGTYVDAAIKMYTNYDGADSTFGNTEVYSTDTNKVDSSIYASVFDDSACELHLVVINKNIDNNITGTFNITSPQKFTSGRVWKFDNNSYNITETTAISSITNNSFTYTVPKTSVCHIVLQTTPTNWDLTGDCRVNIYDLKDFAIDWLNPNDFVDFADFAQDWGI